MGGIYVMNNAFFYDLTDKKILLTGGSGLIGKALQAQLETKVCKVFAPNRQDLNLLDKTALNRYLKALRPDAVIHCAALVGGIEVNRTKPSEFLYKNITMSLNLLSACHELGIQRVVNLGSSCFYPVDAAQPISEDSLLTGSLEPTNQAFATAKIAAYQYALALKQQFSRDYITVVPANVYGPGDHFDLERGHVIPAMLYRFKQALLGAQPTITFWGTGSAVREFIYVSDAADGIIHCLQRYNGDGPINIGGGETTSIKLLAELLARHCQYKGLLLWDDSKPNGMPFKSLDSRKIESLAWKPKENLNEGLEKTVASYL